METKKPYPLNNFSSLNLLISKIVCGGLHTVVLTSIGDIYTWGCNDDNALGRAGEQNTPLRVPLPCKVDLISAGDSSSVVANSKYGFVF